MHTMNTAKLKFKIGDIVTLINNIGLSAELGAIGKVTGYYQDIITNNIGIRVQWMFYHHTQMNGGYDANRFVKFIVENNTEQDVKNTIKAL